MAGPIPSTQLSISSCSNAAGQALAAAPEPDDPWAIFHGALQVEITQLDAEYEPLLKQKKQEKKRRYLSVWQQWK